jgi:two-component system chemotaxis response regulator CheY
MVDEVNKTRVLVVEDEKIITMQISRVLSHAGYDVVGTASDGSEAIIKANELRPDVILMDLVMPRMHGLDAIKSINGTLPDTNIIVVTGLQSKSILTEALKAGAKDGIFKPFKEHELLEIIAKYTSET